MQLRQYEPGETIFEEGAISDSVCLVVTGRVEVVKEAGSHSVVLGHIGDGEFVGEMGVIEGRPRSATVRAEQTVTVEWYERDEFLRIVSEDSQTALELINRLGERLGALNDIYSETVRHDRDETKVVDVTPADVRQIDLSSIRIYGEDSRLVSVIGADGIQIDNFPFLVGRASRRRELGPEISVNLMLEDSRPYSLSRVHFAIVKTIDGYQVRDMLSTLGTSVNGNNLGRHFGNDRVTLDSGDNLIIAGGRDSEFRFKIVC